MAKARTKDEVENGFAVREGAKPQKKLGSTMGRKSDPLSSAIRRLRVGEWIDVDPSKWKRGQVSSRCASATRAASRAGVDVRFGHYIANGDDATGVPAGHFIVTCVGTKNDGLVG